MAKLIIEAQREGYATEQVHSTMTVEDLIEILSGFEPDTEIYLSHDNGYTFGGIHEMDFELFEDDDEDEDYED